MNIYFFAYDRVQKNSPNEEQKDKAKRLSADFKDFIINKLSRFETMPLTNTTYLVAGYNSLTEIENILIEEFGRIATEFHIQNYYSLKIWISYFDSNTQFDYPNKTKIDRWLSNPPIRQDENEFL